MVDDQESSNGRDHENWPHCAEEVERLMKQVKENGKGRPSGMTFPECDHNGNYKGKQCSGNQ